MITLRKILFPTFILLYTVICPLIILDSLGITIKPGRHKLLTATGLISVDTIPQGASIYVNDKLYRKKSPAIVRDLSPDDYTIKIVLKGHHPWQKNITVEKEQATALESTLLIPLNWEKQVLSAQSYDRLITSEDIPFFLLQLDSTLQDLYIYRYKEGFFNQLYSTTKSQQHVNSRLNKLLPSEKAFSQQKITSIKTMPQSPFVLLELENKNIFSYIWLDTKTASPQPVNISSLFINPPENIFWDKDDENSIFYVNNKKLNRIDIDKKMLDTALIDNIKGYSLFNRQLFFMDNSSSFTRMDYIHDSKEHPTGFLSPLPVEFKQEGNYKIHLFSENLIVFLNDSGQFLSNKLPYVMVDKGVIGFSKKLIDKKLIFWTKEKLGIINFTKIKREGVFEKGPDIQWLNVKGKNIRQAFWVNGGTHVLYVDRDQVKLIEAGDTDNPQVNDVVKTFSDVVYSDELGQLFYLDHKTRQLTSLTILPSHEFISFKLPENFHKRKPR